MSHSSSLPGLFRRRTRCSHAALGICTTLALLLPSQQLQAATYFVEVGGSAMSFSPAMQVIDPGDTVTFLNRGGVHNVVADNGAFRCARGCDNDGVGGSGGPSGFLWFTSVTFPSPGTYGYFCETHGTPGTGMFGTIVVRGPAPTPPAAVPAGGWVLNLTLFGVLSAGAALRLRHWRRSAGRA